MIIAINYADERFRTAQKYNSKAALRYGADKVIEYSKEKIDKEFYDKNKGILDESRGSGYWLWKPYIIRDALYKAEEGDYIVYTDAGAAFVDRIDKLISCMKRDNADIMLFSLDNLERRYTKRDALILMDCDSPIYYDSFQRLAGYEIYRRSDRSLEFVEEWLEYATDRRIITDDANVMGQPDHKGFIDHRHDQSTLSLLSKKWKIDVYRDPSQDGLTAEYLKNMDKDILNRSTYPQIIDIHRNPNLKHFYQLSYKGWYKWIDIRRNPAVVFIKRVVRKVRRELTHNDDSKG